MMIELNEDEREILLQVLNNTQHQRVLNLANLLKMCEGIRPVVKIPIMDWIKQTNKECDVINILKEKVRARDE
jgi:hypothetical protein